MKKKLLLSKQGIFFRLVSTFFQCLIFLPVSIILSVTIAFIIVSLSDIEFTTALIIPFIVINVFWVIYNSFIRIYNDKIVFRSWIGQKQTIELNHISELKIITSKQLKAMILELTPVDPLITNTTSLIIPMGNFITFKNSVGRDVVIGVWNVKTLYNLLSEKVLTEDEIIKMDSVVIKNNDENEVVGCSDKSFSCFVKLSLKGYVLIFFTHFYETILYPVCTVLIIMWLLNFSSIEVNKFIFVGLGLMLFALRYCQILRVVISPEKKTIKLNLFSDNNKNVIKYDGLKKLDIKQKINIDDLSSCYKNIISTNVCDKNISQAITFQTSNDSFVALSVNKTQDLYDVLEKEMNILI